MKIKIRRIQIAILLCLAILLTLTGCKASKKKVLESTYYKELKKENQKLKKEKEALEEEVDSEGEINADVQRAAAYLDKISRDSLVKLEVGYAENMRGSEFVEDKAAFSLATAIASRADLTEKYTPDEVEEKYGPGYEYILYDEDNAVYEIMIFGGNYIVFTDLPNNVYYAYNASALGDAFLHYKEGYPNSTLLHRLADAPLVTDQSGVYYENAIAFLAANTIDGMGKRISSRKSAEKVWKTMAAKKSGSNKRTAYEPVSSVYTFYHHGNTMKLTIYDKYFVIENMNGDKTWYRAKKKDVKSLKNLFKKTEEQTQNETKKEEATERENTEKHSATESHDLEIEKESSGDKEE